MIGRTISHYQIVDEISRGGMGVVYRAIDVHLGREVAVKVLPQELLHDPVRRERLLQEARAASALEHPNIGVIHEVGDAEGVTFIAMELIRGEKLAATIGRGSLLQTRALDLAVEMAEGLARAHAKDIVHRDLKPANVMVTDDGHVKIIDFGLAKLIEPVGMDAATATVRRAHTDAGMIVGTAAYMSPEQARGGRVDRRTDIFALGLTLYEMITGRPAFQGQSQIDTLHAILTQPVPPLPAMAGSSQDVTAELQRIIVKCTAKDPDDRFQDMRDLIVDLRAARRRMESSSHSAVAAPISVTRPQAAGGAFRRWAPIAAGVLVVAAGALWVWWGGGRETPPVTARSGKPSLAVLYFENNTGDPSLDWMRTGLTDMMVNDLSQSPDFEVIGTDRLYQILKDLKRADDRVIAADVVQEIATRADVDRVLLGSFVRAGDTIRISARLQEASTGRIMGAERVEGVGEASIFSLVDELMRRFRGQIAPASGPGTILSRPGDPSPERGLDRGIAEITTASIDAYRYYAEGIHFHERSLGAQAVPLLEKAIDLDPDFAMAHAKLAVVSGNLGLFDKRDDHAKRALDRLDRLTTRERYYIEGYYYSLRPETLQRAIDAYRQGLALHPEHQASRHNLGLAYMRLGQFSEGIEQYEELLRRGTSFAASYDNLAAGHIAIGNVRRGREITELFVARHPDSARGLANLGGALVAEGRLGEARDMFEKAHALDPLDFIAPLGLRMVAMLEGRWADVEAGNKAVAAADSPFERFLGLMSATQLAAARGRGREMLTHLEATARIAGVSPLNRAYARNRQAQILLRNGNPAASLAHTDLAWPDARGREVEIETLRLRAVALAALKRKSDSDRALAEMQSRARVIPGEQELHHVHWALSEIALLHGDAATAAKEIGTALGMLPVNGPPLGPPTSHTDLWLAGGIAYIAARRDADALPWLERLQSSYERFFSMEAHARSFFLRAGIHERRGEADKAREQYTRFLDLWRDGDLERGWVAQAKEKSRSPR